MKTYGNTKAHTDKESLSSGKIPQRVLVSKDNETSLSEKSFTLSFAHQVVNAETFQAFDTVSSNHSFASTNGNNDKVRRIFSDSQIAKGFHQVESKPKFMIQFGVATYVLNQVIKYFTG